MTNFTIEDITSLAQPEKMLDDNKKNAGSAFVDIFKNSISEANNMLNNADLMAHNFAVNKTGELHEVVASMEEATIALNIVMQSTNKVLEGYKEIMRLQV